MQNLQERFVGLREQGRSVRALPPVDSSRPGYYLVVPAVTRVSGRRRSGARREPACVLLGPFCSEIEARFIETSAQALGLLVERTDRFPSRPRAHRNNPTPIDCFSDLALPLN
ncbi:hypothetical protein [Thauera sp. WH-1]|uniref:hypothetical protein n=1 Tax=Thauera sp. WH-1 TaxID=3398230 RepID=UPI0039FBEF59